MKDLWPKKLLFETGAYQSSSYRLEWLHQSLVFTGAYSYGFPEEGVLVEPNDVQWADFWMDIEQIKIWKWAEKYDAPVMDGTGWSLELEHNGQKINTYGHMAYPDPDDVSRTVELTSTEPYEKLIQALNKLCGSGYIPD